jgi:hypothetical protein
MFAPAVPVLFLRVGVPCVVLLVSLSSYRFHGNQKQSLSELVSTEPGDGKESLDHYYYYAHPLKLSSSSSTNHVSPGPCVETTAGDGNCQMFPLTFQ